MTVTEERRVTFEGSEVETPKVRGVARRLRFWLVLALILAFFIAVSVVLTGTSPSKATLSATNPAPNGAEALVGVLRSDGVSVDNARSLKTALKDATGDADHTTIVLYDPSEFLSSDQLNHLAHASASIVLIEPSTTELDTFAPSVAQAGYVPSTARAGDCTLTPVQRAGTVSGLGRGYRLISDTTDETGCLGSDRVYSLVKVNGADQTVWVLGSSTVLTNGNILRAGNAALGLGVIGHYKHVVWYLPTFADVESQGPDGVIPVPPWVTLVIVLLALVGVAAIFWRGRRFGPLVVERMPVFVKANETAEGRARLYQKASARAHSLDALRIGKPSAASRASPGFPRGRRSRMSSVLSLALPGGRETRCARCWSTTSRTPTRS